MTRLILMTSIIAMLSACAEHPLERDLVVDGHQSANYNSDLRQCQNLAENYDDGSARNGAIWSAALGGLIGGADDGDFGDVVAGAAIGGALGGLEGSAELDVERRNVLIRCMQGRGHRVVG